MSAGVFKIPVPKNEPILDYAPNTPQRAGLKKMIDELRAKEEDIPMYIGGEEVRTKKTVKISPPHDHKHTLGFFHEGDESHVNQAIQAALNAREKWAGMSWEHRASIFLKAADLISGPYRNWLNAATMLGQSKNPFQSEIDAVAELADFLRFNAHYMEQIYSVQPESPAATWNRLEYRPLEGFVFAITPFNFTSIGGNLPASAAIMGNTVVWKPATTQIYSANVIMKIFLAAGLPPGVINLIYTEGPLTGKIIFEHPDFSGIHFTGSTGVFRKFWEIIGNNISKYKTYPRIVGETGGKDFILAHPSTDVSELSTAILRGAFEFQGQKCSAASRAYVPSNLWPELKEKLLNDLKTVKMGGVEDFTNFINAVIDERAFDKISGYIEQAKESKVAEIISGGGFDKSKGYFIQPTIIEAKDPQFVTMCEEIFGPVMTIYVYNEDRWEETVQLVDQTSPYALTGAIFSKDREAIEYATKKLVNSAGNFYINDKPTGAVVGQQPFGGSRASGTNDKAGSMFNLLRWVSMRTIKENFLPPTDYRYPFMDME